MIRLLFPLFLAAAASACGPWFPSSYLNELDEYFIEELHTPTEIELIAKEYQLIKWKTHPSGWAANTLEAERSDFRTALNDSDGRGLTDAYARFAKAARVGDTNAVAPVVPERLAEFTLYLEGTREFINDPSVSRPAAWDALLALDFSNRLHRTPWVHYMLGNIAGSHGRPEEASRHYAACRAQSRVMGTDEPLGLAHASYKNDFLCQTNLATRLEQGVAAVGYYSLAKDYDRMNHCMAHLRLDMIRAAEEGLTEPSTPVLEAMTLFLAGDDEWMDALASRPDLKITPRLAWLMYRGGEIEKCAAYLEHCGPDDPLANWLRYRLAQRAGKTDEAIEHLEQWFRHVRTSDRILFSFLFDRAVSPRSVGSGHLGALLVERGDLLDALDSFVSAGAYVDAALIAERYLETEDLKNYLDGRATRAPYHALDEFDTFIQTENSALVVELRLSWLLARRLFREGRAEEALPYYPPEIADIANDYLDARKTAANPWKNRETRAAKLYHAARLLRWKGMELSGTELHPDYTIVNGHYEWHGVWMEDALGPIDEPSLYAATAPFPNERFHYRHVAAELAGEAARLSWNRHRKAMMRWSAGAWIQNYHPDEADVYYKKLVKTPFQPLAKAADGKRWFPASTPMMDYVHRSEDYVEPRVIANAVIDYATP